MFDLLFSISGHENRTEATQTVTVKGIINSGKDICSPKVAMILYNQIFMVEVWNTPKSEKDICQSSYILIIKLNATKTLKLN